jgi:hypothetical protein
MFVHTYNYYVHFCGYTVVIVMNLLSFVKLFAFDSVVQ